jgi:hypothetical protein
VVLRLHARQVRAKRVATEHYLSLVSLAHAGTRWYSAVSSAPALPDIPPALEFSQARRAHSRDRRSPPGHKLELAHGLVHKQLIS